MEDAMQFRMKALKTFMEVRAGDEFDAGNPTRAQELEARGLAIPLDKAGKEAPSKRRTPNKAAAAGPLLSPGGQQTGAATAPSSSPAGRARPAKKKTSRRSGGKKSAAGK
jgi:hypothetical protein